MKLSISLDEADVRQAVVEWFKTHHHLQIKPEELQPLTDKYTEGEYEDTVVTINQVGYEVTEEGVKRIFPALLSRSGERKR